MEKLTIESCKKIQTYKDVRELLEGWKKNKVESSPLNPGPFVPYAGTDWPGWR